MKSDALTPVRTAVNPRYACALWVTGNSEVAMRRAVWIGVLVGVVLGAMLVHAWEGVRYARGLPVVISGPRSVLLAPVEAAPAQVLSGTPNFRAAPFAHSPDRRSSSGIWACDGPTTFDWSFGSDEVVHVLEGRVDVTYQDRQFTLLPGDTAVFYAGTQARWHVSQHVRKSYTLYHPGWITRLLRAMGA